MINVIISTHRALASKIDSNIVGKGEAPNLQNVVGLSILLELIPEYVVASTIKIRKIFAKTMDSKNGRTNKWDLEIAKQKEVERQIKERILQIGCNINSI